MYLALLVVFGVSLANYVWGDRLMMKADGLLLRDQNMIAATSIVRIEKVNVRPGQKVSAGDILFEVGSLEIIERLTDYSIRNAQIVERTSALEARRMLVTELLPLAQEKYERSAQAIENLEELKEQGLVAGERGEQLVNAEHEARTELLQLNAERESLDVELASLQPVKEGATTALKNLSDHYANGVVRAAHSGFVGDVTPSVGEVFLAGKPILSVITGKPYVLAYLPETYIFEVPKGLPVEVQSGRETAVGKIAEILPVSQTLPEEFQNAFRPNRTRQLARIEFDDAVELPTFANVRITQPFSGDVDAISKAIQRATNTLTPDKEVFAKLYEKLGAQ